MPIFTENIQPDSLTGALFAIEGIKDACTVLNGPSGCKFYHSAISDSQYIRGLTFDPTRYLEDFFKGQPRIPATYLDGHDYVFGSSEKLTSLLRILMEKDFKLIAVVNSPGAALIGDNLEGFLEREVKGIPCFAIENTGYSGCFSDGYQKAIIKTLSAIEMKPRTVCEKTVNFLGLSIYQKHFKENYQALKALLALCGVNVICAPGAGDDVETLKQITQAQYNVAIFPEYAGQIAQWMEQLYGIPFISLEEGPPIGFDATASFVKQICGKVDANPQPALERIDAARAKAYLHLARFSSLLGLPKGATFGIRAEASVCFTLAKWLANYLGMVPTAISVLPSQEDTAMQKLLGFLADIDSLDVLENPIAETPMHILFADGSAIAGLRLRGKKVCGVELALPSLGYLDVTDKYILGENGALFLLEQIMNGLRCLL